MHIHSTIKSESKPDIGWNQEGLISSYALTH